MSDTVLEAPRAPAMATSFSMRRIESIRNTFGHDMTEGVEWRAALDREYWMGVVDRFRPGDVVAIHSFDHRVQYNMHILDVNTSADPIYLDAAFLPVYPA